MTISKSDLLLNLSAAFKMGAVAFAYPADATLRDLVQSGIMWEVFSQALAHGDPADKAANLEKEWHQAITLWEEPVEEVQAVYCSTFDLGSPAPPVAPYAGVYLPGGNDIPGPRTKLMAELQGHYQRWGLAMNGELPDHVAVELEFMHFLLARERQALAQGDETLASELGQDRVWLSAHLAEWFPAFRRRLAENEADVFWRCTAGVISQLVV